jgi:hypothetical protein
LNVPDTFPAVRDILYGSINLGGLTLVVAVIKTELKSVKENFERHETRDNENFESLRRDIRSLWRKGRGDDDA